jgi:hypothetical protein
MKKILLLIICTFTTSLSWGDSPLTYTEFHKAYIDVPIVQSALSSKGKISNEIMSYLVSDTNPLDVKLAIINAIGWSNNGAKRSEAYLNYVVKTKKYTAGINGNLLAFKWNATADELICFAYVRAMEDYFDVIYANEIAQLALQKNPNSLAVNLISGLIKAQGLFLLNEWCYAAIQFNAIEQNTLLTKDLRTDGKFIICEYVQSMGANCD